MDSTDFSDRVVIVTGGGSGMGKAMVHAFATRGATVYAFDLTRESAAEGTSGRERCQPVACDVSRADEVAAAVAAVVADTGRIDVLCNNAGILDGYANVEDTSVDLWQRVIGVNLTGPFLMAKAVIPEMVRNGGGAIVNTASIASLVAGGGGTAYTASKHGIIGLTKALSFDYGKLGVRANAICPGGIRTGMTEYLFSEEGRNEHVDAAIAGTPAGRWGTPEEIASMAVYLAGDDAGFMFGATVVMDGGWTLT